MDLLKMPGVMKCEFKKHEYLIRQGEQIDAIYYLLSGVCYRTTVTERGDEIIYGVKESNDMARSLVGVMILYGNGISVSNFIAQTKCECYKIPRDIFLHYAENNPALLSDLLRYTLGELRNVTESFQARLEGKVANRLCGFLLKNAKLKQGKHIVDRRYNNAEISRFLGIHKVTVAKIIKVLKTEGIINKSKDGIVILNEEKLTAYAKSEVNMEYK